MPLFVHTWAAVPLETSTANEEMVMLAAFATTSNMMPFRRMHSRLVELPAPATAHVGVESTIGGPVGRRVVGRCVGLRVVGLAEDGLDVGIRVVGRCVGLRVVGAAEDGLDEGFDDVGTSVGSRVDEGLPVVGPDEGFDDWSPADTERFVAMSG